MFFCLLTREVVLIPNTYTFFGPTVYRKGPIISCLCACLSVRLSICLWRVFQGNRSNDFLEIWHEVGNPEILKRGRNRFLKKNRPPPFWPQKGQILAKIALFAIYAKMAVTIFLKLWILSTKMDTIIWFVQILFLGTRGAFTSWPMWTWKFFKKEKHIFVFNFFLVPYFHMICPDFIFGLSGCRY